jgi:hypothetical protein
VNEILASENPKRVCSVEVERIGGGARCLAARRGRGREPRTIQR